MIPAMVVCEELVDDQGRGPAALPVRSVAVRIGAPTSRYAWHEGSDFVIERPVSDGASLTPINKRGRASRLDKLPGLSSRDASIGSIAAALRSARDLEIHVNGTATQGSGWPVWWVAKGAVLFGPRPDGRALVDANDDADCAPYHFTQFHSRKEALVSLRASESAHIHFGLVPTDAECKSVSAPVIRSFLMAQWVDDVTKAMPVVLLSRSEVAAVCGPKEHLWIADTGCGRHLCPESDIDRSVAKIETSSTPRMLATANGVVDAREEVRFSLPSLGLDDALATILASTPRVLTVGGLCIDERADFHWFGSRGWDPYFDLAQGGRLECEVHGKIPYVRSPAPAMPAPGPSSSSAGGASPVSAAKPRVTAPLGKAAGKPRKAGRPPVEADIPSPSAEPPAAVPPVAAGDAPVGNDPVEDLDTDEEMVCQPCGEQRPPRDLKVEAVSITHLMTHYPKNPWCPDCMKSKCPRKHCRRMLERDLPEIKQFADLLTMDHIVAHSKRSMGVTGDKSALAIEDRATGYFEGYPLGTKGADNTGAALREFLGTKKAKRAWTDGSGELQVALAKLNIVHDTATPYRPQTNGRAERLVRKIMEGTRTLLLAAGLPPGFWPYAMRAFCFGSNIAMRNGDSAWNRRHKKGHFQGKIIPFGALVDFRQNKRRDDRMPKAAPDATEGIFLGYKLNPGVTGEENIGALHLPISSTWTSRYGARAMPLAFKRSRK